MKLVVEGFRGLEAAERPVFHRFDSPHTNYRITEHGFIRPLLVRQGNSAHFNSVAQGGSALFNNDLPPGAGNSGCGD